MMEDIAVAMGKYLKSGEAAFFPDIPVSDNRIVPIDEVPEDAVIYEVRLETNGKKAITYSCDISLPLYLLKHTLNSYVTILAIQSAFLII